MNPHLAELVACGRVHTDGTGNATANFFNRGCAVARTGAGVFTATLDRAVDADQCLVLVQGQTADQDVSVAQTDTVKTMSFAATPGGGAGDADFFFAVFKVAGGGGATGL